MLDSTLLRKISQDSRLCLTVSLVCKKQTLTTLLSMWEKFFKLGFLYKLGSDLAGGVQCLGQSYQLSFAGVPRLCSVCNRVLMQN